MYWKTRALKNLLDNSELEVEVERKREAATHDSEMFLHVPYPSVSANLTSYALCICGRLHILPAHLVTDHTLNVQPQHVKKLNLFCTGVTSAEEAPPCVPS